ncbi:MAG: hypothetical protein LRY66_11860 [Saccharospirillaceae bacterium]|nr:hypothetical protein [Saccharospirillaceae bacterium]
MAILSAWLCLPFMPRWYAEYGFLLQLLPYGLGMLLLLLAQLFNQGRIGQMTLLTLATYALIQQRLQVQLSDADAYWLFFWLCLLWPLNAAGIRYLPERRPLSVGGLIFPVILGLQFLALAALSISDGYSASIAWTASFREQASAGLLPLPAWISFTLGAALMVNACHARAKPCWHCWRCCCCTVGCFTGWMRARFRCWSALFHCFCYSPPC